MTNISVFVGLDEVDVDVNQILFSLSKELDTWDDLNSSTQGQQFGNVFNQNISLPATQKNQLIFQYSNTAFSFRKDIFDLRVTYKGVDVFVGNGQVLSANLVQKQSQGFTIQCLGGEQMLFQQLEGVNLNELDLGEYPTLRADIMASQTPLNDVTSYPVVFAPAVYGSQNNDRIELVASDFRYKDGLRPSVRIFRIFEAIFVKKLGYRIISNLYENATQFRNLLYPFGVNNDWERADDYQFYIVEANVVTNTPYTDGDFILFPNDVTDPYNLNAGGIFSTDPPGLGSGIPNGTNASAWFDFEIAIYSSNPAHTYDVVIRNIVNSVPKPDTIVAQNIPVISGINGSPWRSENPLIFHPQRGETLLIVRIYQNGSLTPITVGAGSYYKATMNKRFAFGADLKVASCLHALPVKDFLRGMQHLYGLIFCVDAAKKIVFFDPRFVANVQDIASPATLINPEVGYYEDKAFSVGQLDYDVQSVELVQEKNSGDGFEFGYKAGDNAPYEQYISQFTETAAPLYGAKIVMRSAAKNPILKESRNPFFAPIINTSFENATNPDFKYPAVWPLLNQDISDLKKQTDSFIINPPASIQDPPDYTFPPTIAQYYGLLDFSGATYNEFYRYTIIRDPAIGSVFTTFNLPFMGQLFPDNVDYFQELQTPVPFILSYSDVSYQNALYGKISGLISRFHQKFLAIADQDVTVKLRARQRFVNFLDNYLRKATKLNLKTGAIVCWVKKIENLNPQENDIADFELIADAVKIGGTDNSYQMTGNADYPLLQMGFDVFMTI